MPSAYGSQDAIRVARAFIDGIAKNGARVTCGAYPVDRDFRQYDVCGKFRIFTDGQTIWSYGRHFPVACRNQDGSVCVTTERYQTGTWPVSGKPKYGPTTDSHIRAVQDALTRAGYEETERFSPDGKFRVWILW